MKKLTFILLLSFTTLLVNAQEVLLGQYEFVTGTDQLKASNVTEGVEMGDIVIDNEVLSVTYNSDAVEISNWGIWMGIGGGKCLNIPITKTGSANEFNVSRINITLKRTTANKIQINFGNEINTFDSKAYAAGTNHGTTEYASYNLIEGTGTGAVQIPAKTDVNTLYLSIGTQSASSSEVVYIDKIEVYGTVDVISSPTINASEIQKNIKASLNYPLTFSIVLSGAYLTDVTNLSLIGTNASSFTKDITTIQAAEFNASPQTVQVTYNASELTYNALTRLHTPHTATLRIENPDITTIDIKITATCNVLFEDFSNYDATANSETTLAGLRTIPDNLPLSITGGWFGDNLYEYKAGGSNLATVCLGSTSTDSAFLTTPELDLSQPFDVFLKARSLLDGSDGIFKVYLDGDQLIYDSVNTTYALRRYQSETYIGSANSRLTFTGRKTDLNEIIVDSIVVVYSLYPTLNIPLNQTEDFAIVSPGGQKTIDIPIKGYNLTGDVNLSLLDGSNFSILSGSTVTKDDAMLGSDVTVRFNSPVTIGTYSDKLIVGTSDFRSREITLVAKSDNTTSVEKERMGKVIITGSGIELIGYMGSRITVYNLGGAKVFDCENASDNQLINLRGKGCFMLRIEQDGSSISRKVMIF